MKKEIKGYIFIKDAFGPMPVWTLQHPVKEARDFFMIHPKDIIKKPVWLKNILILENASNKIINKLCDPNDIVSICISGEVKYHIEEKTRIIDDLKISYWAIEGTM